MFFFFDWLGTMQNFGIRVYHEKLFFSSLSAVFMIRIFFFSFLHHMSVSLFIAAVRSRESGEAVHWRLDAALSMWTHNSVPWKS